MIDDDLIGPSGDRVLIHDRRLYRHDFNTGQVVATGLDDSVLPILDSVVSFAPAPVHLDAIHQRFGSTVPRNYAETILRSALDRGVLMPQRALLDAMSRTPGNKPPPFAFVGIPTNKTNPAIEAVVRSIQRESIRAGGPPVVVSYQGAVPGSLAGEPQGSLYITDRATFQGWTAKTTAGFSDKDRRLIEDALGLNPAGGFQAGANRNRLLLIGAGARFAIVDDDQPSRYSRTSSDRLVFSSRFNPMVYHPLASIEERDDLYEFVPAEAASLHDPFVSRTPFDLIRDRDPGQVRFTELRPEYIRELRIGGGRARVSMIGLAGDWGIRTPLLLATGTVPVRGQLDLDRLESTIGVVRSEHVTVSDSPLFRSSHCGYDGTAPLPPFAVAGRNGDGLFGAAVSRLFPHGAIVHLPLAVEHYPKPQAAQRVSASQGSAIRVNDALIITLLQLPVVGNDTSSPLETFSTLAAHLRLVSSRSIDAFRDFLVGTIWDQMTRTIDGLRRQGPFDQTADQIEAMLGRGEVLAEGLSWEDLRRRVAEYARLLELWPELWDRAADTDWRDRGIVPVL